MTHTFNTTEELVGLLRDCVSQTWMGFDLDKAQKSFDEFLINKGYCEIDKEKTKKFGAVHIKIKE